MAGRAGRPQYDIYGEAIIVSRNEAEAKDWLRNYVSGMPEPLTSKLKERGVLTSHILSLIAMHENISIKELKKIISKTLLSKQGGMRGINKHISSIIDDLVSSNLVKGLNGSYKATRFGVRVSQLYIQPETAVTFKNTLNKLESAKNFEFNTILTVCITPDMEKPYLRRKDEEILESFLMENEHILVHSPPDAFEDIDAYEEYLRSLKTALIIQSWIDEKSEGWIEDEFSINPGDLYRLVDMAQWLTYSMGEIAKLFKKGSIFRNLRRLRVRVRNGIREELIELVQIPGVGRIRARNLYNAGFKNLRSIVHAEPDALSRVPSIGESLANKILYESKRILNLRSTRYGTL